MEFKCELKPMTGTAEDILKQEEEAARSQSEPSNDEAAKPPSAGGPR
jgi:hypothetical protein